LEGNLVRRSDRRTRFVLLAAAPRGSRAAVALLFVAATLAGCGTPRPVSGFLAPVATAANGATEHTIFVATTRQRDPTPGTLFNGERSPALSYAELTVSVPPTHVPGAVEFAKSAPGDPNTDFVARNAEILDGDKAFLQALNAQLALRPKGKREIFLFVHGFNTLFAEAAYTHAQVVHDSGTSSVPVVFTWASRGDPFQYVYDNNSATVARDNLVHTLNLLLASNAEKVNILAHSMGNWVTVEAFRQMKLTGGVKDKSKIGVILLAAPDLDFDVFKSELHSFGKIDHPFYVILSRDDKALGISSFIAGGQTRVGNANNAGELTALGATVIDLSDVQANDPVNHGKFMELATIGPQMRSVLASGVKAGPGPGVAAVATNSLVTLLGAPVKIIGAVAQ
jgi:esterase/lipase superfamily enzyme